jgi:hypothetical protein
MEVLYFYYFLDKWIKSIKIPVLILHAQDDSVSFLFLYVRTCQTVHKDTG